MMIQFPRLQRLREVRRFLTVALLVLAIISLGLGGRHALQTVERMRNWLEYRGEVIAVDRADEGLVEIEVPVELVDSLPAGNVPESCYPHQDGNTCLIVPRGRFAWLEVFDEIAVLQNPDNSGDIQLVSLSGLWLPVLTYWLAALFLAGLCKGLERSDIGDDLTWVAGRWVCTASASALESVGRFAVEPQVIHETNDSRKAVVFWTVLFGLIAVSGISMAVLDANVNPLGILLIVVVTCGICGVALFVAIETRTRAIYQDGKGFLDSHFFRVKRVPWSAVASLELVNLSRDAQARYDRTPFTRRTGGRPTSVNVHIVKDATGQELARFSEKMAPAAGFNAFITRLRKAARPASAAARPLGHETSDRQAGFAPRRIAAEDELCRSARRSVSAAMLLMLAPFLLMTCLLGYRSLWFQYGAEATEGVVVTINRNDLPSLIVEYRVAADSVLRVESDGSDRYAGYRAGDRITVFYDPADPANARLDLFPELWLGTLFSSGLTLMVVLLAVLIRRHFAAIRSLR